MHDFAGICIINAAVVASSIYFNKNVNSLREELISGRSAVSPSVSGLRGEINGKLDSIQADMRLLIAEHRRQSQRLTNLEQHKN